MSKIKLTQEQAEIIEETKFSLAGFSNEMLVRCLNGEYEVEPRFKAGDWVHRMSDKKIYRVEFVTEEGLVLDDESLWMFNEQGIDFKNYTQIESVRHATLKEITGEKRYRWWSGHGRKVWELRKGDILINAKDEKDISVVIGFDADGLLKLHSLIGDYINRLPINEVNYDRFRVLCFAESRLDGLDVKDDA